MTVFLWLASIYLAYRYGRLVESTRLRVEFEQARRLRLEAEELARESTKLASEARRAAGVIPISARSRLSS